MAITNNSTPVLKKKRTSQGRRKIEIKKIDKISSRQVTFSKRRGGIFRKASELCILTGAEIAVIVHSQGNRVFTFGHTSVDSVVGRYLHGGAAEDGESRPARDLNRHYSDACKALEEEKRRTASDDGGGGGVGGGDGGLWCHASVDGLGLEETELYLEALNELIRNAVGKADDLMHARAAAGGGEGFLALTNWSGSSVGPCDLGQT